MRAGFFRHICPTMQDTNPDKAPTRDQAVFLDRFEEIEVLRDQVERESGPNAPSLTGLMIRTFAG